MCMDEAALVAASLKGKDEAFAELINNYKLRLYRMAYAYLRNEQDALEAVQETTFRAYAGLKKLKDPQHFGTWVIRILINYCVDEQKRQKKNLAQHEARNEISTIGTIDESKVEIYMALERLELRLRKVIFLKYFGDLTTKEIAVVLGYPEGTVKTWLYRGLTSLKRLLQGEVDANV